jgi:hypothetical protein
MKNGTNSLIEKAQIKSDYTVLHFDEFPILFSGKNCFSEQVVGSLICEEQAEGRLEYFHSLVTAEDFDAFIHQKLTYLDLMKKALQIFHLKTSYQGEIFDCKQLAFNQIPSDRLPSKSSFCPTPLGVPAF